MRRNLYDKKELEDAQKTWKKIPEDAVPSQHRDTFLKRKLAVEMYIGGNTLSEIEFKTGINRNQVIRCIHFAMSVDQAGQLYGESAFIPYAMKNLPGDNLKKSRGNFGMLVNRFPELEEFIMGNYYGLSQYTLEKNMNFKTLHNKFLVKCKELGVQEYEYPFNTENLGYVSLINYIKSRAALNIASASMRESRDKRQKIMSTGHGVRYSTNPFAPYQMVQVDGHIIDLGYHIQVDLGDGTFSKVMATRPWLFVVIDVSTRCILGFSVSQEFNYNQYDVLSAIRNAIEPRKRITFTVKGFQYPENGGYPSLAFPETKYAVFNQIMLDNAKSHLAENTVNKLVDLLGCSMNFGSVATPETRGIVERFFGTLETKGFHRLPATTGSNSKDLKRNDPEKNCVKYNITYDEILELLEVLIAEYNNSPNKALYNETPMQAMERKLKSTCLKPHVVGKDKYDEISQLSCFTVKRKVKGGLKSGKRPYIQYENATYRNNLLTSGDAYVGKELTLLINPADVSSVDAYTSDGTYLGKLSAAGEYGRKPHSLKSRKAMASLARQNNRQNMRFSTPVSDYEEHLREEAKSSRRSATKADILRREQGKPTIEEKLKEEHRIIQLNEANKKDYLKSGSPHMSISEFVELYKKEHNGKMPGPKDYLELSLIQKTI